MKWGILINLAAIFLVSGLLLFVVFCGAMQLSRVDDAIDRTSRLADMLEKELKDSFSAEDFWEIVSKNCRWSQGLRPLVYDSTGTVMGGCGIRAGIPPPDSGKFGRRIRTITAGAWPKGLLDETILIVDMVGGFPQGARTIRGFAKIPPLIDSPSWRFFVIYLVLSQGALFFLGYLLFHRTVVGPVKEVARMVAKSPAATDLFHVSEPSPFKGDIQRISEGLQAMVARVLEESVRNELLVTELRHANKDLKNAQEGLVRSEKMAVVGRLASGLAHEIGNPLQIVMGYMELLGRSLPTDGDVWDIMERTNGELKRIHEILSNLLQFARPIRENLQVCDLNAIVADSGSFLEGRKGFASIDFRLELDPEISPVLTEPGKIRQILLNLIFNAADATSDSGGVIVLRTRKSGDTVELQVEDSGAGIPSSDLHKVFDPFYTTKEPGKGTGLGLTVCQALVESLGGSIDIRPRQDRGTIVTVRFPGTQDAGAVI